MRAKSGTSANGAILRGFDIFSSLSGAELLALSAKMRGRSFAPGESIFREGESGEELFVVASGLVSVSVRSQDAEDIELSRMGRGAFFGEMAILERAPRSATCRAIEKTECLVLKAVDFESLLVEVPSAAVGVLERMLGIAAGRLLKTGSFLSQMVQWGDAARKRAITDAATGLFNRRYLEDSFETILARAKRENTGLSFAMFDLDRFGKLNAAYGAEFCDRLIVEASGAFRQEFAEDDILVRYGGDEFCFLLPCERAEAERKCEGACAALRSIGFAEHPELRISCSIGLAHFPLAGASTEELKEKADKALYQAKESGRDRVCVLPAVASDRVCVLPAVASDRVCVLPAVASDRVCVLPAVASDRAAVLPAVERGKAVAWQGEAISARDGPKRDIAGIARKNRVFSNIVGALEERDSFLIIGHRDPDEDCISSMVAFALLANKFNKKATIAVGPAVQDNYDFLANICRYNSIEIIRNREPPPCSALVLVDTPKPDMIDRRELYDGMRADPGVLKIELDHHLEADSSYFGDPDYRLVYEASSTCEIIGRMALKLEKDERLKAKYQIEEFLSRNLVLAILSGMIGDSQMGRYLKTRRERWFYARFSAHFERMLVLKTRSGSGNFSRKEQVFAALAALSDAEEACFRFMSKGVRSIGRVGFAALDAEASRFLFSTYGNDTAVAVSKALVDRLAETSGFLGLVGYYDDPSVSPFAQFRLRRSQAFTALDLRDAIVRLRIVNGGGHPGAVGIRIEREALPDIEDATEGFARALDAMIDEALASALV